MTQFNTNEDFWPTPRPLAMKMMRKIKNYPENVLDIGAGKGNLVEALKEKYDRHRNLNISAIEIDTDLQAVLRAKDIKVIDSDFLSYSGPDKFDLIISNPPFSNGDSFLLKAIDIMYSGQIVFLLNAETLKNPYSNTRKDLVQKLTDLNAEIEYIPNGFTDAERKTSVEVALISIVIEKKVEDDLFGGCGEKAKEFAEEVKEKHEVSTGLNVKELVVEYNETLNLCLDTIIQFYKNYRKVGAYIHLNIGGESDTFHSKDLTKLMQYKVNETVVKLRVNYWRKVLELKEVKNRMTESKRAEFEIVLKKQTDMEFSEHNVRAFVINLIDNYDDMLSNAVVEIFDWLTIKHHWHEDIHCKNVHYYSGWKTNSSYKINRRVIIPFYGESFRGWRGWSLNYQVARKLKDIDIIMNYFNGMSEFVSIIDAIEEAFKINQSSGILSTFFKIKVHKKGTLHLEFLDNDILSRFNRAAAKHKNWLPPAYGKAAYEDLKQEEKIVIDEFEGEKEYTKNLGISLFICGKPNLQLEMLEYKEAV